MVMNDKITKIKKNKELTAKQKAFCDAYLLSDNQTKAYMSIYNVKNENVASASANRMLGNVKVIDYLAYKRKLLNIQNNATPARIIREYERIAFFDPRKLFDNEGNLKRIIDLDDDTAAVIAAFDITATYKKAMEVQEGGSVKESLIAEILKKLKHVDKKGALDSLSRINGMFIDKIEQKVEQKVISQFDLSKLTQAEIIALSEIMNKSAQ